MEFRSKVQRREEKVKNKELQDKVNMLQNELSTFKNKIDMNDIKAGTNEEMKFLDNQEFQFNGLVKLIKNNPQMVKMTMIDNLWQETGTNSESRK